ncbi:hypothetical protein CA85_04210 [Allorhodopirellula solitaria]|uniref:Uncharacterized protein n=1 Tax=Allorhodopirellula solitaria TaxID=2527987 RepID=A0A5C5YJW2_9BACT|nr:hypothetical protein CA85_04210 [Allorhodopirellula solitaria]
MESMLASPCRTECRAAPGSAAYPVRCEALFCDSQNNRRWRCGYSLERLWRRETCGAQPFVASSTTEKLSLNSPGIDHAMLSGRVGGATRGLTANAIYFAPVRGIITMVTRCVSEEIPVFCVANK